MDTDELREDIQHQRNLQKEYRRSLRVLEEQAAGFGALYVPPYIKNEIDDLNENMQAAEKLIKEHKQKLIEPHQRTVAYNKELLDSYKVSWDIYIDGKQPTMYLSGLAFSYDVQQSPEEKAAIKKINSENNNLFGRSITPGLG